MQNLPTRRLSYAHGLLRRLHALAGPATLSELLAGPNPETLFKTAEHLTNPEARAQRLLRHAVLLGVAEKSGAAWTLTALGESYLAAEGDDPWDMSAAQAELLERALREQASRGDSFALGVALAVSLLTTLPTATAADLARGMAQIEPAPWKADQTFDSQGTRYLSLLRELRLWDGKLTPAGHGLLYEAELPEHPPLAELLRPGVSGRWWWVNQNATFAEERELNIMWAPLLDKAGRIKHHWETMDELVVGDQVVHYRGGKIVAVSVVTETAVRESKPAELATDAWEQNGRLVRTRYRDLKQPIPLSAIPHEWRQHRPRGPFNRTGGVNQGYLFELSDAVVEPLLERFPELSTGRVGPTPVLPTLSDVADTFAATVKASGLAMPAPPADRVRTFLAAAITKRFVILTGMSGSGKTQLALRFGEWFGVSADHTLRLLTVPVRPDWVGPEALFGYRDALRPKLDGRDAWFVPQPLEFLLAARRDPEMPYLMVLDEMNLAHVERYFSDFLSGIESRKPVLPNLTRGGDGEWRAIAGEDELVPLPANVFVVGTVNVDETTYMFSPKVLDRAFTFEIRTTTSELDPALGQPQEASAGAPTFLKALLQAAQRDDWHLDVESEFVDAVADSLRRLHAALARSGNEFGHRVFIESLRFAAVYDQVGDIDHDAALDQIVMLKVLPRIHGSRKRVEPVLKRLLRFAYDPTASPQALEASEPLTGSPRLPVTAGKLSRMLETVQLDQFVSFTE